jgi:hypothetical protein
MSSFQSNFQSLIGLKSRRLDMDQNQQTFDMDRAKQFMPMDLDRARIGVDRDRLGFDRAKQMLPHEVRMMELDGQSRAMQLGNQAYSSINTPGSYGFLQQQRRSSRPLGYASGGPVQDVAPRGVVPVRVSNGEYEFTPEQVAAIGAALLSGGSTEASNQAGEIGAMPMR